MSRQAWHSTLVIQLYLQNDVGNIEVVVDFLMDGAENTKETNADFDIEVFGDPVFHGDPNDVKEYTPSSPCSHDHISIQVFHSRNKGDWGGVNQVVASMLYCCRIS